MAVPQSLCRLCINMSNNDLKSLYDEHGQTNGLYEMIYEYFHPKIVNLENAKHLTAICSKCFRHIHDFHSFQTSVIIAQLKLIEEDKTIYKITEEIEIPQSELCTQAMAIKVEHEEFIGYTPPDYVVERDCPQIMKEESLTLVDIQIEDSSPSTSKSNDHIIESFSMRGVSNEEEDRKDSISLPPLEITDVDESSSSTTYDVIPLAGARKTPFSMNETRRNYDKLLSKWIPNIKCYKCSKSFPAWLLLSYHFKQQHPNEKFHYICCSRKFNRVQIRDHLLHHEDPDAFKCSICDKRYINSTNLSSHYTDSHPESLMFPCDKCNKRCISKPGLAQHYSKMHSSPRKHLSDLRKHRNPPPTNSANVTEIKAPTLRHSNNEEVTKSVTKSRSSDGDVTQRISTQISSSGQLKKKYESLENLLAKWIPNIKCFKCKKSFPSWPLVEVHFKRHHPNENFYYICCSRRFTRHYIKDHLCLHSDYDAFKCSTCGVRYKTNNSLAIHYNLRHPESFKFPCAICQKRFISDHALTSHQRLVHKSNKQYLPDLQIDRSSQPNNETISLSRQDPALLEVDDEHDEKDNMTLPILDLLHPPSMSEDNNETTVPLSIQYSMFHNAKEVKKENILHPPLENLDVDTDAIFLSDDEIPPAQIDNTKPRDIHSCSSDSVVTQTIDNQKLSCDPPQKKCESLEFLLDKWIPIIKCYKCLKSFPSWPLLKIHIQEDHPNAKFYYMCCSRKFTPEFIKYHLCLHDDPDAFKCFICGKRYTSKKSLVFHYNDKHSESHKFPCDMCRKRFLSSSALVMHQLKMHNLDRQYPPDLQINHSSQPMSEDNNETTELLSNQDLSSVQDISSDEEENRKYNITVPQLEIMDVDTSDDEFTSEDETPLAQIDVGSSLSADIVTQTSYDDQPQENPETLECLLAKWMPNMKCFKCSKPFSSWPLVKDHFKQQHPNDKFYYMCCSRKFTHTLIKDHLLLHSDPEAFKCLICHKHYKSSLILATHLSKIHHSKREDHPKLKLLADGRTAYNCQLSGETKYSKSEYRLHKSGIHGLTPSKIVCTICGTICVNIRTFREHLALHENKRRYKCAFCPRAYRRITAVKNHRKRSHPLENGKRYYIYIGDDTKGQRVDDTESKSNKSATNAKSISAAPTENYNCEEGKPPITIMGAADLQDSEDNIKAKLKMEDVNTDSETSCDGGGEIEQKCSISSVSIKNEDDG